MAQPWQGTSVGLIPCYPQSIPGKLEMGGGGDFSLFLAELESCLVSAQAPASLQQAQAQPQGLAVANPLQGSCHCCPLSLSLSLVSLLCCKTN